MSPLQYFKMFFHDKLIDHLVEQTNLYFVQESENSIKVDRIEMERYLGITTDQIFNIFYSFGKQQVLFLETLS